MSEKVLSCFIDEAGDFGEYDSHSPFYIVSVVLHEQLNSVQGLCDAFEYYLAELGYSNHALHTGPLIRRESEYKDLLMENRKRLFNLLFVFTKRLPIRFFTVVVKKSECKNQDELEAKVSKAIGTQIDKHEEYFNSFDKIIIYYDNGQKPLKRIINAIFSSKFSNVELRRIRPEDYKLFQVADLICTVEHIKCKIDVGIFSKTEKEFFSSIYIFKKDYWKKLDKKRF